MGTYVGEIKMFAGNFAPVGWAFCNGQQLPISENDVLFALLGTTYGGDGQETFRLPNLCGRVPIHQGTDPQGNTRVLGEAAGTESVTLTIQQIPNHTHQVLATNDPGTLTSPANNVLAGGSVIGSNAYGSDNPLIGLHPKSVTPVGGSQPHENMQPFLGINFIISLFGEYPTQ